MILCLETEGLSSGRRFGTEHTLPPTRLLIPLACKQLYHTCTYNRLPEDDPSSSESAEDIVNIKILV
jgi:hypothetical protein